MLLHVCREAQDAARKLAVGATDHAVVHAARLFRDRSPDRPSDHGGVERSDRVGIGRHQLVPDEAASRIGHVSLLPPAFCHSYSGIARIGGLHG